MAYVANPSEQSKFDLAAKLDAATVALADYIPGEHDETDELGILQHISDNCPHCEFNKARSAYRGTLRTDVLERNKALKAWAQTPHFNTGIEKVKALVEECRASRTKAHIRWQEIDSDLESSPREVTEAAVALEGAELDFETVYPAYLKLLNYALLVEEQIAAVKRQKAGDPDACFDMAEIAWAMREWFLDQPRGKEFYLSGRHKPAEWCERQYLIMSGGGVS